MANAHGLGIEVIGPELLRLCATDMGSQAAVRFALDRGGTRMKKWFWLAGTSVFVAAYL